MRIFSSTILRLILWYVGILALVLILFASLTYFLFSSVMRDQIDSTLSEIVAAFEKTVNNEFSGEDGNHRGDEAFEAIREATMDIGFKNYKVFVFSSDGKPIAVSKTGKSETEILPEAASNWLTAFDAKTELQNFRIDDETVRVLFSKIQVENKSFQILVVHPLEEYEQLLEKIRYAFLISVPLALIFASFGGYFLAHKSFEPVAEMNEKAEKITAQNLHERLPVKNEYDEIGRLASSFNRLLSRLDLSFEQQKRFMADASHELRTPVSIVRGEAEVSLTKKERSETEYRETIQIMGKEAERMSTIIEDLFTLSRADSDENSISIRSVYLEDILQSTVKGFRSIASKNGISLLLNSKAEMPMLADERLLERLFTNLIDNGLKHAKTKVMITAGIKEGAYAITFEDDGSGILNENRDQIFERFFREDAARSRKKGHFRGSGAGLGLSISRWIAEVHQGTLKLNKSDKNGSFFTVELPVSK